MRLLILTTVREKLFPSIYLCPSALKFLLFPTFFHFISINLHTIKMYWPTSLCREIIDDNNNNFFFFLLLSPTSLSRGDVIRQVNYSGISREWIFSEHSELQWNGKWTLKWIHRDMERWTLRNYRVDGKWYHSELLREFESVINSDITDC